MRQFLLAIFSVCFLFVACKKDKIVNENPVLELSKTAVNNESAPFKDTIQITSTGDWNISKPSGADWISFSPGSGTGNGKLYIDVSENKASEARSTTLTVKTSFATKEIKITQTGIQSLGISKTTIDTSFIGFKDTIQIITSSNWTITDKPEWITLSKDQGSGITDVFISTTDNNTSQLRSATLQIKTSFKTVTLTIKQAAIPVNVNDPIKIILQGKYLNLSDPGKKDFMYIEDGTPIDLPANKSFSISLKMINLSAYGTSQPRILYWNSGSAYLGLFVDRAANDGKLGWLLVDKNGTTLRPGPLGGSGSAGQNVSTTSVNDGKWHHVVLVYDADKNESYFYIDGNKEGVVSGSPAFNGINISTGFLVGDFTQTGANWNFGGAVDDLHFWKKAVGKAEAYVDAANIVVAGNANNMLAGWDFEQITDGKIRDITNKYNGVLKNGASNAPLPEPPITDDNSTYRVIKDTMLFPKEVVGGVTNWYYCAAITTLNNGDLLIAADQRRGSSADVRSNPNIGLAIRKSTDNGQTWSTMQVLNTDVGISDPSFIVDKSNGNVFIFGSAYKNGAHRLYFAKSTNGGASWSNFEDRSTYMFNNDVLSPNFQFIASGRGLYSRAGKMMQMMDNVNEANYLVVSSDHGATWQIQRDINGKGLSPADESKIVELNDGSLMVNARASGGFRYIFSSSDGGKNWTGWQDKQLPDPYCNAGFIAYTQKRDGFNKNRLLFSNCATTGSRTNLTVKVSYDEGQTWSRGRLISIPAGYSELTILKDGSIGLAYCAGDTGTRFARFTIEYLTDGKDKLDFFNF